MKILVAEDEQSIASQYKMALESGGHEVQVTIDGENCLEAYTKALRHTKIMTTFKNPESFANKDGVPVPFDTVVLDYRMPKKDGMQVAKEILALCPEQRIIFASAYVLETLQESVKELGQVVELLQKPFDLDKLVDTIEDKGVYEELAKLKVKVRELKDLDVTHAQLIDLLAGVKKLQNALLYGS
jgi:CheY-like chemotaxis protein